MMGTRLLQTFTGFIALASVGLFAPVTAGAADVTIEKISYEGWSECYRMSNGEVELIACADIGPRVFHFGFVGGQNFFGLSENTKGQTGGDEWKGYGGHRLWIAPELDFTYHPDNEEVRVVVGDNSITMVAAPELADINERGEYSADELFDKLTDAAFRPKLFVQKTVTISMSEDGEVTVDHAVQNVGVKAWDIAPWALTVMAKNGKTIVPNAPYAPHGPGNFLPVRQMILWSYTKLNDPRVAFLDRYFTLQQDPDATHPFKVGFSSTEGWAAYSLNGELFVKRLEHYPDKRYPDMGASVELFTNSGIMEIESLGPQVELKPGETMNHRERWALYKTGEIDYTDEGIDAALKRAGVAE